MSISFGVALIIIFQKRYFGKSSNKEGESTDVAETTEGDATADPKDSPVAGESELEVAAETSVAAEEEVPAKKADENPAADQGV
jgi:hypothetical protein